MDAISYISTGYWNKHGDPRTVSYPLIGGGILPVCFIIACYLLFVLKIGPQIMKNRKPMELRLPLLIYNSVLVMCNFWFFTTIVSRIESPKYFLDFTFPESNHELFWSPVALEGIRIGYLVYLSKFLDLGDTIFFVLRKKDRQITFLHLYHHSSVPLLGYMAMKVAPLIPGVVLFVILNCFVHIVMYLYYALAAFGPAIQPYLWWKRYITLLQLGQFVVLGLYGCVVLTFQTGYPFALSWVTFFQTPLFFIMFYNFYQQSYKTNQKKIH